MSRGRSSAYWAGNRYTDAGAEPDPSAPLVDLPSKVAQRFRALREGLLALDGVAEHVRFMGESWRWAWEYGVGNRKLCWLHFVRDRLSVTFTLGEGEEDRLGRGGRIAAVVATAISEGQKTGPVKWCWLELDDARAVEAFLRVAARKAEWLAERPRLQRSARARSKRNLDDDA
jgi:Protein of unknown function (DUF3788)